MILRIQIQRSIIYDPLQELQVKCYVLRILLDHIYSTRKTINDNLLLIRKRQSWWLDVKLEHVAKKKKNDGMILMTSPCKRSQARHYHIFFSQQLHSSIIHIDTINHEYFFAISYNEKYSIIITLWWWPHSLVGHGESLSQNWILSNVIIS